MKIKKPGIAGLVLPGLMLAAFAFSACAVEKTREGKAPEVKVEEGNLPEYRARPAEVTVDQERKTIRVPDVDVQMKDKTVTVPDIDVRTPRDDDRTDTDSY